jgi:hypothetical protein
MSPTNEAFDATVRDLAKLIDAHVVDEREQLFLEARYSSLDLRGMTVRLLARKKQLTRTISDGAKEAA